MFDSSSVNSTSFVMLVSEKRNVDGTRINHSTNCVSEQMRARAYAQVHKDFLDQANLNLRITQESQMWNV